MTNATRAHAAAVLQGGTAANLIMSFDAFKSTRDVYCLLEQTVLSICKLDINDALVTASSKSTLIIKVCTLQCAHSDAALQVSSNSKTTD